MYTINELATSLSEGIVVFKETVGEKNRYLYATRNADLITALTAKNYTFGENLAKVIDTTTGIPPFDSKEWTIFDVLTKKSTTIFPHFFSGVAVEVCKSIKPPYSAMAPVNISRRKIISDKIVDQLNSFGLMSVFNKSGDFIPGTGCNSPDNETIIEIYDYVMPEPYLNIEGQCNQIISMGNSARNKDDILISYQHESSVKIDSILNTEIQGCIEGGEYQYNDELTELSFDISLNGKKLCFDLSNVREFSSPQEAADNNDGVLAITDGMIEMSMTEGTKFVKGGRNLGLLNVSYLPATLVVLDTGLTELYINKF